MPAVKPLGRPRATDSRAVLHGILYIARWLASFRCVNRPETAATRCLAVSNLDGESIDVYGLAVDLRPVLQKDLVSTWRHRGKQETVAVGLCEGAILRRKRNLAIGAGRTIEQRPHPNEPAERGIGLRAERDDDAASHDPANGKLTSDPATGANRLSVPVWLSVL